MAFACAPGFPVFIALFFWGKNRTDHLWLRATASQPGAVYDNTLDAWFVPDSMMKRDFGFLFMVLRPFLLYICLPFSVCSIPLLVSL